MLVIESTQKLEEMLYCQLLYFWIHSVSARLVPTRVPKGQIKTKEELKRDEECDLSLSTWRPHRHQQGTQEVL